MFLVSSHDLAVFDQRLPDRRTNTLPRLEGQHANCIDQHIPAPIYS